MMVMLSKMKFALTRVFVQSFIKRDEHLVGGGFRPVQAICLAGLENRNNVSLLLRRIRNSIRPTNFVYHFMLAAILASTTIVAGDEPVEFNRDVQPILAKHCFACHGRDEDSREADLRLDQRESVITAEALVPGKPDESELITRVESNDPDLKMPPPDSGHELTTAEMSTLRRWIANGAEYQLHWSFVPPTKAPLPKVKLGDWPVHAIDYFVLKRLEDNGLAPSEQTDKARLLRRVSLDLTGLPPTLEEADAFLADTSEHAFEHVVDRLLRSEAYGEQWARMWLDLARYADTKGYEKDRHRDIWRYRDWVIDAFNRDMPFDQFTVEQLSGDLLPNRTTEQILATAFHRNTMTNDEGGTDNEEFRVAAVKDRVDTTIQVWMGLTMGCAKCHAHKYDPISLNDYYSFYAFFNQTQDADNEVPLHPTPTAEQLEKIAEQKAEVARLKVDSEHEADAAIAEKDADKQRRAKVFEEATKELKRLESSVPKTPVMLELSAGKQRPTRIHHRGNFLDQGDEVTAAVVSSFGGLPDGSPANRLGVARWLMQPDNPLTARVMVNRLWARLFGVGIVETEEDFGTQGLAPSHPELLDWLAVEFREQGWSIKKLLKTIVMSKTYQQAATTTDDRLAADPQNRLLSRGPRFRLSAEMVRDQALAVSGLLTKQVGGPSVMPPQPGGIWKSTYSGEDWKNAEGPNRYRRGLYTYLKRTSPYPAMITFDAGSGEVCQIRRVRTNTPLQALVTLNDTVFLEAAGALAHRMEQSSETNVERIANGFRMVLVRQAEPTEIDRLVALYDSLDEDFLDGDALLKSTGLESGDVRLVAIANVLLNLDETLTK